MLTAQDADAIAETVRDEMQEAVTFGLDSPFPEPAEALDYASA